MLLCGHRANLFDVPHGKRTIFEAGAGDRVGSPGKGILCHEAENQGPSGDTMEPEGKAGGVNLEPATELSVADFSATQNSAC